MGFVMDQKTLHFVVTIIGMWKEQKMLKKMKDVKRTKIMLKKMKDVKWTKIMLEKMKALRPPLKNAGIIGAYYIYFQHIFIKKSI